MKNIIKRITGSISFYPVVIALGFLVTFWLMIRLDQSPQGKHIKTTWEWLRMKDAEAARIVATTIASGMLAFTVFSFSMVMIVLNQTASKLSNRILEIIIRNRFQQIVLGSYIGTVTYSIFLITAIRDTDSGIYVPALSTFLLILFAIADIFLFIYFLHFVTQFAKFQTIIDHIHQQTLKNLDHDMKDRKMMEVKHHPFILTVPAPQSGYLQEVSESPIFEVQKKNALIAEVLFPIGSYVLEGSPVLRISSDGEFEDKALETVAGSLDITRQPTFDYVLSGFQQLTEVAIKALSPGINDPQTAVLALNALGDLFKYIGKAPMKPAIVHDAGRRAIIHAIYPEYELLARYMMPVWDYGKDDRIIQETFDNLLFQLLPHLSELRSVDWVRNMRDSVTSRKRLNNQE